MDGSLGKLSNSFVIVVGRGVLVLIAVFAAQVLMWRSQYTKVMGLRALLRVAPGSSSVRAVSQTVPGQLGCNVAHVLRRNRV